MKILIDTGHPAHVHLFKNFAREMIKKGHQVLFTTRQREFTTELLTSESLQFVSLGRRYGSLAGKIYGLLKFNLKLAGVASRFRPDLFLSCGSMYAAQVSWLFRKPHITFEDTGNMEQVRLYKPFTDVILTSTAFHKDLGEKQLKYHGYHDLAYLYPGRFTPDPGIIKKYLMDKGGRKVLLRFVSWQASHDIGNAGLAPEEKIDLVKFLEERQCHVYISSENDLPDELQKYRLGTPPHLIHHVLAFIDLYIGEGATMASECADLGTPAVYINTIEAGTIDEQEKYGLVFHFRNFKGVKEKIAGLLDTPSLREKWQAKRGQMLKEKIDLTAFLLWFVENFPGSRSIMKEDPDYQFNFR